MPPRTSWIAACRSSFLLPVTRTTSPWIDAVTLSLASFSDFTIFFARSLSTPFFTVIFCFILSPPIFCASSPLRKRASTPRLAIFASSTSRTWPSLKSSSAKAVISCSFSFSSRRASDPLKSKRLAISLLAVSTAFFSSTALASHRMSNDGMTFSSCAACRRLVFDPAQQEVFHQRLLHVQPVFRLLPDDALGAIQDLGRHLLAAVGGKAMHEERLAVGGAHERLVHLVARKGLAARPGLAFPAHAGPHVGRDEVRVAHGFLGCRAHDDVATLRCTQPGGVEAVALG